MSDDLSTERRLTRIETQMGAVLEKLNTLSVDDLRREVALVSSAVVNLTSALAEHRKSMAEGLLGHQRQEEKERAELVASIQSLSNALQASSEINGTKVEKAEIKLEEKLSKLGSRVESLERFKWGAVGAYTFLSIVVLLVSLWGKVQK